MWPPRIIANDSALEKIADNAGERTWVDNFAVRCADLPAPMVAAVTDAVRQMSLDHKEELARMAVEETGMGRVDHKIMKIINTAAIQWISIDTMS